MYDASFLISQGRQKMSAQSSWLSEFEPRRTRDDGFPPTPFIKKIRFQDGHLDSAAR